ncbi:branched-chain amino acid ABC transporter substrate-binding protein [Herbaspirillum sp. YR522]|uniref:branched-chain amino acid ABC transporter substrate-binding protein n=1 Tax=Herbaspirillum sp. YR522 TaxID=1144342 RepID=UPI00026F5D0C|nr:branched-chain amino acid ABC transporter substrate-binding protein [Herbaspirillum sp. YR522]EJM97336.1 ABC-type branched-chain amino acid transport system, periplasmic component [Herbaspirillum sp. YR522]
MEAGSHSRCCTQDQPGDDRRRQLLAWLMALALPLPAMAANGKPAAPDGLRQPAATDEDPATTLRIGFAGPLSGPSAGVGKSMHDAVLLAVEEANQRGVRIGGKPWRIRLIAQDDRADSATAEYVARYLVGQKVIGVIGHWNSGASLAAAPIYHAAGVIQISPATMSRRFTAQAYPAVFRTIPNNESVGLYSAHYAVRRMGIKSVVTIDDRTPFGQGLAEQFARAAHERGAEVLGTYSVSEKTSDFNGPLLQIRHRRPQLIFFGGLDWQAGLLAKAIARLNIEARLMVSAGSVGLPFLMSAGAAGNGAVVLEPGAAPERMPGWKAFRQRYGQRFDSDLHLYASFAYDAVQALLMAIRQRASSDPTVVAQELHRLRFTGVSGPIAFNDEGDLENPSFTVYEVQQQRWMPLLQIDGLPR